MSLDQNQIIVEQVASEKDLGVIFDEKLLFMEHIVKRVALANRNLGMIFKSFTYTDREMLLNLYFHCTSTSSVCHPGSVTHVQKG